MTGHDTPALDRILIPDEALRPFLESNDPAGRARALLLHQRQSWDLCGRNYAGLENVRMRTFRLGPAEINVQWNPGRLTSTSARVDEQTIRTRRCFLCPAHLPEAQRGLLTHESYLVLCNPYPILPEHFTIPHLSHVPQRLEGAFATLLGLARDLGRLYTVFYNGPRCGASAPDHLHFQAGTRDFLPLERDRAALAESSGEVIQAGGGRVVCVSGGLRPFLLLQGRDQGRLERLFDHILGVLAGVVPAEEEPMMNLIVRHDGGVWDVLLFPRIRHRPSFFFAEGEDRILLSPAAVDLGGVCVVPMEHDFLKITSAHLERMFREVCLTGDGFAELVGRLRSTLKGV